MPIVETVPRLTAFARMCMLHAATILGMSSMPGPTISYWARHRLTKATSGYSPRLSVERESRKYSVRESGGNLQLVYRNAY
jgi:hypothetical protein